MEKLYRIKTITEMDFGCEGRPENTKTQVQVLLEGSLGSTKWIVQEDEYLYAQDINEHDIVCVDEKGRLQKRFVFRNAEPADIDDVIAIEQICFPPHEACSPKSMTERVQYAGACFQLLVDCADDTIAGFINGIATDETKFRDAFFTDISLHNPAGKNIMIAGVDVLPQYEGRGLAGLMMNEYKAQAAKKGREKLILTNLQRLTHFYERMGFVDLGISDSTWGEKRGMRWSADCRYICRFPCDHTHIQIFYTMITTQTKQESEVIIMKKGLTELVFILDRSGSMCGLEQDTIGGFNGMLERQKQQEGEVIVTTVLFDTMYSLVHDRIPIESVKPMTQKEYYVGGCTALLDAIGNTIHKIVNVQKSMDEAHRAEKVIFVIITDGMENASREYSYQHIKNMIEHEKEKYGWEFMFLGANIDAVAEAEKMGIHQDRAVTYSNDSEGVALNYETVAETVCMMRSASCMGDIGGEWKKNIEENQKKKKRRFFPDNRGQND